MKLTKGSIIGLALLSAWAAGAGPLKRSDVAAQTAWVMHFDLDALRSTQVGTFLIGEMEKPEAQAKFAAFQMMFNFDPRKQLHGVTMYNAGSDPRNGVLIVYADFEAERLVTLAKAAKQYEATLSNGQTIHSWYDERKRARVYAAILGQRVIFGQSAENVSSALGVCLGAPSLATSGAYPQLGTSSAFIQAASQRLQLPEGDPSTVVFRLSKGMAFNLTELQQKVTASLSPEAGSEEVATNMLSVVQGLVSLVKLQKQNLQALKLAEAVSVAQNGNLVIGTWSMPAADAIEILKAGAARHAATQP